ncbi:biopolymer transporter ExbD [Flavobacterium sp.]|jgi:biopolymer transport protein ExbD|uniref:ExbD/TolR family protein n=1 Tax=Flavobacterium sp. TaxID=239 RepID=UPI0022C3965C|nr:biopolymer transporter ExbD [Flavobacterium sp.]MCZ8143816.1 biopolymer transporter ExbD [Flavobacterium sp.]MCZ8367463.1 biopolymer transporter ExbD [Flavobacterium sp.]
MAKVKMSKKAASIDMTAMCDVAFLLLTFFILTATAKNPEPLQVETPNSTVQSKLPEENLAIITIGGKDKVFYGIKGKEVRKKTLELMGAKYGIQFTENEIQEFSLIDEFGVPIEGLKQLIAMKGSDRNKQGVQPGIPHDTIKNNENNQLRDWIYTSRQANIEVQKEQLNFAIKGDAEEQYPRIKQVMDELQKQTVNSFNLVTGLRGKNY